MTKAEKQGRPEAGPWGDWLTARGTSSAAEVPGALLGNLVLMQALAWRETIVPRPEIHYWRTRGGIEVDFVIEAGRRLLPVEVKAAQRVRLADARGLGAFLEEYPKGSPFGFSCAEVVRCCAWRRRSSRCRWIACGGDGTRGVAVQRGTQRAARPAFRGITRLEPV